MKEIIGSIILLIIVIVAVIITNDFQINECKNKGGIVVDNGIGLFEYCINEKENKWKNNINGTTT